MVGQVLTIKEAGVVIKIQPTSFYILFDSEIV